MMTNDLVALVLLPPFAIILFIVFRWLLNYVKLWMVFSKFPGPRRNPLFGNALQLKNDPIDFFKQIDGWTIDYKSRGIFRIWIGPAVKILIVFDSKFLHVIFGSSKHITKAQPYDLLHPWLGTGLLTSSGNKWKKRRRMLTPTFHFKILNDFVDVFTEQSDVLVKKLKQHVDKEEFNIFPYVTLCALDIISETAMGVHLKSQDHENSDYVQALFKIADVIQQRQKKPWLWNDWIYNLTQDGREHNRCLKILHGLTTSVIKNRNEELAKKLDIENSQGNGSEPEDGKRKHLAFLDLLLHMHQEDPTFTFEDIREEVDTFMFEGHDTTAAAMTWALFLIGSHPEIQLRLHEEIDRVLGDSTELTTDSLKELKYLECTIKEALRLYPSVPFIARNLDEDVQIDGIDVPKSSVIVMVSHALHRDEKQFPDPEKFDPDRFLPENSAKRHPYAYVPFSAGFRNCIGQRFALMEEKVVLATILKHYRIEATQRKEDINITSELILRPQNRILVKISSRQ